MARLPVDERRSELVEFGEVFFAKHPYDSHSMAEIAKRAGVSKSLLYHYFGGRRGFYVATIRAIAARVDAATAPDTSLPFAEAFAGSLERYLDFVANHGDMYRALIRGGVGVDPEVAVIVEGLRRKSMDRVLDRLGIETASPSTRVALYGWVCFAENSALEWLEVGGTAAEEMLAILVDALHPVLRAHQRSLQ